MALDPKTRKVAMNFTGGTLTASLGLLEAIWGPQLAATMAPESTTVSVRSYSRQRLIGGATKTVAANTYNRKKYPVGAASGAAGGEAISLQINGKWWTARLSGSHQAFCDFLRGSSFEMAGPLFWKSERGTSYGPFSS